MQLIPAADRTTLAPIRKLYRSAFPAAERKPFSLMLKKQRCGQMEILSVCEGARFFGLVITVLYKDIVLLDYFAISPDCRGHGVGTSALELIRERYRGKRLLLEIEDPEVPADNTEERQRRQRFYLQNGMTVMPWKIWLFGIEMLVLTNQTEVAFEEYHEIFTGVFSPFVAKNIRKR